MRPITAAGLPPMSTVEHRPSVSGAVNGIGGPGCGLPTGPGIWCSGHMPVILSPMTMAGAGIAVASVQLDHGAVDIDGGIALDGHARLPLRVRWFIASREMSTLALDVDVLVRLDDDLAVGKDMDHRCPST